MLLAHTATVAPADVQLDGRVVFQDIANGEYAEADVPAGEHRVALLPSGSRGTPILGAARRGPRRAHATMAYAYGRPRDRSMNVIVHTVALAPDGSVVPRRVETGSAGLARTAVRTFSARPGASRTWSPATAADGLAEVRRGAPRARRRRDGRRGPRRRFEVRRRTRRGLAAHGPVRRRGPRARRTSRRGRRSCPPGRFGQARGPGPLRLPSGRVVPVAAVSTTPAGVLDVPRDVRRAGWWRGGSRLGDPQGSTLVAAHVDSTTQGLGPFSELLGVGPTSGSC